MKKPMVSLGAVASIIGGSITIYGQQKYDYCNKMRRALEDIARNSPGYQSWSKDCDNYRLVIIVGAIILVVGIAELNRVISGYEAARKSIDSIRADYEKKVQALLKDMRKNSDKIKI